jgi:bacteriocin-type transport-associated protein
MRKVLFVFSLLTDSDIDWLVATGTRKRLGAGTLLIQQGRPADALFVVLDGRLAVSVTSPAPRELARLGSGEMVGELSFLDARPPAATVKALDNAMVLAIPRVALAAKLKQDTGFASRFYHALGVILAHRLRNLNNLAYGDGRSLGEEVTYDDELETEMLDSIALAGARFDWILKRLHGT